MKEQLPVQVLAELFGNSLVYAGQKFAATEYIKENIAVANIKKEQSVFGTDIANEEPVAAKPVIAIENKETIAPNTLPVDEKSVTATEKPQPVEEKVNKPGKWYLGNYEKKFIVLVKDSANVYLGDKELELLTGILNACKMNLAQIALVNFKNNAVNFQQLKNELQPQFLVAFGVNALEIELPFSMPDYQVQQFDGCAIITAPHLTQLNKNTPVAKAEKSKLWASLKKMLSI